MERPLVIDYWAGRRATQTECEAEVERLQTENALLRKVADAARAYLKGGYNETLDELVLTVLELDKEGE